MKSPSGESDDHAHNRVERVPLERAGSGGMSGGKHTVAERAPQDDHHWDILVVKPREPFEDVADHDATKAGQKRVG